MRAAAMLVIVVGALTACDRRAPVASCRDNLHGVWVTPAGARWMLLDNGKTLEGYPLFDDLVADGAPRVIDLERGDTLDGELHRRFMRRAETCDAHAPLHVTRCTDDTLQLVVGDVEAPLTYAPCTWPHQMPSRVETWRRN